MSKAYVKRFFKEQEGKTLKFTWQDKRTGAIQTGIRIPVKIQTNAAAFAKSLETLELAKNNPHKSASWTYFDQKDDSELFTVLPNGVKIENSYMVMTYTTQNKEE